MKKLRIKVFVTIFSILSIFILMVLVINNYQSYREQENNIKEILFNRLFSRNMNKFGNMPIEEDKKIFMDSVVYTVILDEDGNYKEVINHTLDIIDEGKIEDIANRIITEHTDNMYIGNLYVTDYAYSFVGGNRLLIVDCTFNKKILINELLISIIIFITLEVVVYFGAYYLTRWITIPVSESFDKQKRFIADASHELKTPLSVIVASVDAYNNDKNEKCIKNILNESERMNKLITDLLDLAKTDGNNNIVIKNEDISNIILSMILTFESLFYEKKIKLDYQIKDNIMFNCNQDQIKQLISILIDNAIKYSDEFGKVVIDLYIEGKNIVLKVANKGKTISEEDCERIFDRFYKIDSSRNRNNNNYGLGLAIAKNIVEGYGGKISASSKNGMTTFMVVWNQK